MASDRLGEMLGFNILPSYDVTRVSSDTNIGKITPTFGAATLSAKCSGVGHVNCPSLLVNCGSIFQEAELAALAFLIAGTQMTAAEHRGPQEFHEA